MSDKHTGPYVPEAFYACHRCSDPTHPTRLFWMDLTKVWLCSHCLLDLDEPIHRSTISLADHLKSLEPRWVPVSERLPKFLDNRLWGGWAIWASTGGRDIDLWHRCTFETGELTHWLDFTPPLLPTETATKGV